MSEKSALQAYLDRVEDEELRTLIRAEVEKTTTRFGLVFERHQPEGIRMPKAPVVRGCKVIDESDSTFHRVVRVTGVGNAAVASVADDEGQRREVPVTQLTVARAFGDVMYPGLSPVESIRRGTAEAPAHAVINGENYHALEMLQYTHSGKIDLIYIDPPYNTGNKTWKYNDRYVAAKDSYRHSKWLSFMEKRLVLARGLLKPTSTVVISIGSDEVHRLTQLCEEVFPTRKRHVVTVQTSGGKSSEGFKYLHEYLVFITPEGFSPQPTSFTGGTVRTPFEALTLTTFDKTNRPNQAYPIYVDETSGVVVGVGSSLDARIKSGAYTGTKEDFEFPYEEAPEGSVCVWPISQKFEACVWRQNPARLMQDWAKGYIKVSLNADHVGKGHPNKFSIQHLPAGVIKKVESGALEITGTLPGVPTLTFGENTTEGSSIPTMWQEKTFRTTVGTEQLAKILGDKRFPYPKPVELVSDVIRACLPEAEGIVLDFFGGSGTTAEAVLRLNAEDGGTRQCILVTNNELSAQDDTRLRKEGHEPGDKKYEAFGVFEHVTSPRIRTIVSGERDDGTPYSDGLAANVEFFKLAYLDEARVDRGTEFDSLAGVFWLRAGGRGIAVRRESLDLGYVLSPEAAVAILFKPRAIDEFTSKVETGSWPLLTHVFVVCESDAQGDQLVAKLPARYEIERVYGSYLTAFQINKEG